MTLDLGSDSCVGDPDALDTGGSLSFHIHIHHLSVGRSEKLGFWWEASSSQLSHCWQQRQWCHRRDPPSSCAAVVQPVATHPAQQARRWRRRSPPVRSVHTIAKCHKALRVALGRHLWGGLAAGGESGHATVECRLG